MTVILTVMVAIVALAILVGAYYLTLWALHDRRTRQAMTTIAAQVERMQRSRALTGDASVSPVTSSTWAGEADPRHAFLAQEPTGRAGLPRTHEGASNDVAASDVPRRPMSAAVSALQSLDADPTTAARASAGAAHLPTSRDPAARNPTAYDSLLTPLTTRS